MINYRKTLQLAAIAALIGISPLRAEPPPFFNPPQVLVHPGPEYADASRKFQGIPSMAISPQGRLWAVWYAGKTPNEDANNYVVVATSGDDGKTWKEVQVIDPDGAGPVRAFDPQAWLDPDGRLWVCWAQAIDHDGTVAGVWAMTTANPDDECPEWSAPRRLTDGVMMDKPMVLSSGEWVLPASTWRKTDNSARMIVSTNHGQTWQLRGACQVPVKERDFDELTIIERKDSTLWMLVRTKYGIGESCSQDGGRSWSPLTPSALPHPAARFFISRLHSGNLLLVKHGPLDKRIGRSHLTAFLSADDGRTWTGGLLLDERADISYPDGQQGSDGVIHVIYDFSRTGAKEILMAKFTEQDVAQGKCASAAAALCLIVNKAGTGK